MKALSLSGVFEQPDLLGFLFDTGSESQRKALHTTALPLTRVQSWLLGFVASRDGVHWRLSLECVSCGVQCH